MERQCFWVVWRWQHGPVCAQDNHPVNFSAGGGFSVPTAQAGSSCNPRWNPNFRGGWTVNPNFFGPCYPAVVTANPVVASFST